MKRSTAKFWMVLGGGAPKRRHPTLFQANQECERLARKFPGQEFIPLESLAAAVVKDGEIEWAVHEANSKRKAVTT